MKDEEADNCKCRANVSKLVLAGESNNKVEILSSGSDINGERGGIEGRELSKNEETPPKDGLRRVKEREIYESNSKDFLEAEEAWGNKITSLMERMKLHLWANSKASGIRCGRRLVQEVVQASSNKWDLNEDKKL